MKILKVLQISALFVLFVLVIGCNTTYKVVHLDPTTGYFTTESVVLANEIKVEKEIDFNKYKKNILIYVKFDSHHIHFFKLRKKK